MSAKRTTKPSRRDEVPERGRAKFARLRRMTEREIERTSPPELANLPDDFWTEPEIVVAPPKQAISLRVDQDVVDWFKEQGPRYQTRMNAVLRTYVSRAKTASGVRRAAGFKASRPRKRAR